MKAVALLMFSWWIHDVETRYIEWCRVRMNFPPMTFEECVKTMPDCRTWKPGRWVVAGWPSSKPRETCQWDKLPKYVTGY